MATVVADAFADARRSLLSRHVDDAAVAPPLALTLPRRLATSSMSPTSPGEGWPGAGPGGGSPLVDAALAVRRGETRAEALLDAALDALAATSALGALASLDGLDPAGARDGARALDSLAARGQWLGPLHGVPVTVKDIIHVAGLPTRAGSAVFIERPLVDAVAVARLRAAGALILAKVATHEFALGVTTPQCRNPNDPRRISGGSSGGSAVAVATGVGLGSLGTDTRASLRVPAALCGVVGIKPTFGAVPTAGVVPLSWTVDHVGPVARSVRDAALLLAVLEGHQPVLAAPAEELDLSRVAVGVVTAAMEAADPEVADRVAGAIQALERAGARVRDTGFPAPRHLTLANDLGLFITRSEAATFHRAAGTDLDRCLPEVGDQLRLGMEVTACDYLDAQRQRASLAAAAAAALDGCDILLSPTTPITAPRLDDYERFLMRLSQNTILWSLAGVPALSMPVGADSGGMPVGLQLVAGAHRDGFLTHVGVALEGLHQAHTA